MSLLRASEVPLPGSGENRLSKATFLSFHLRKTDIWTDWKVGRCPIWLGTGCVNPKAPLLGQPGLAHGSRPAAVGSSCVPQDHLSICLAWGECSSEPRPLPVSPGRGDPCSAPAKNSVTCPLKNDKSHQLLSMYTVPGPSLTI